MPGRIMRLLLPALVAAALLAAPTSLPLAAQSDDGKTRLRGTVSVQGQFVRLGDLFENAGKNANKHVAYAPAPGRRTILDASWLYQVARANGLDWKPFNLNTRAIVERESQVVDRDEIADAILAALRERDLEGPAKIQFTSRSVRLHTPVDVTPTIEVQALNYDPSSGRFVALVASPAGDPNAERLRISGRANKLIDVPVPAHHLHADDIIGKNDLETIRLDARRVRPDTILDPDDIIGLAARRNLRPGTPITPASVEQPVLVKRRSVVTAVLSVRNMQLTAQVRALQSGSMGDTVQVKNMHSGIVVDAEVIGADRVRVTSAQHLARN